MEDEVTAVCIDVGTSTCKVGFAGDEAPRSSIPTILGRTKAHSNIGEEQKEAFIGYEAIQRRMGLHLSNPIDNGLITNWEDMEKLWDHIFSEDLKIKSDEHPVILTEPALNPK